MKSTGIVRPVDSLGRVVLPKELRKTLGVTDNKDSFEIFVEEDMVILKKYQPSCIFCGEVKDIIQYKNKMVCPDCARELGSK